MGVVMYPQKTFLEDVFGGGGVVGDRQRGPVYLVPVPVVQLTQCIQVPGLELVDQFFVASGIDRHMVYDLSQPIRG